MKKKIVMYIFAFLIIFIIFLGCNNNRKKDIKPKAFYENPECFYKDTTGWIEKLLYPFDLKNINTKGILSQCYNGSMVDSSFHIISNDTFLVYSISNKDSKMEIYRDDLKNGKYKYFVATYKMASNIFNQNGIHISMTKTDFFKKSNIKPVTCDTFSIRLRDYNSCYFYFKNDTLRYIEKIIPEL